MTCVYHFLVNTPQTDDAQVREAKALIERIYDAHRETKSLGTIVLNLIRILPDTRIEQIAREDGTISDRTDLLYPVYYDPEEWRTLRYELEVWHQKMNVEMWQEQNEQPADPESSAETISETEDEGTDEDHIA